MKLQFYKEDFAREVFRLMPSRHEEYSTFTRGKLSDHIKDFNPQIGESSFEIRTLPNLKADRGETKFDAQCAQELHQALRDIPWTVAKDRRLWLCLAHEWYSEYIYARWNNVRKYPSTAKERIGLTGGITGLEGHALARLWWGAELSHDETNQDDPYWLLKFAFSNQDFYQNLFESPTCRNKGVMRSLLKAIKSYFDQEKAAQEVAKGDLAKRIVKEINAWAKVDVVEIMDETEINQFVLKVAKSIRD